MENEYIKQKVNSKFGTTDVPYICDWDYKQRVENLHRYSNFFKAAEELDRLLNELDGGAILDDKERKVK